MDNKVPQQINDIVGDNVKKLAQLFPSAVKDGEVDFEALKEELGQYEEVGSEKYELTWAGKKNAKRIAQEDVIGRTLKFIPDDSKDADTTENLYIEGDNLEVLKLLRQDYYGAIKMIYIDPPYNTGNDFVYNDSFVMSQEEADIADGIINELGERYSLNVKSGNKYHANWINMLYPRLKIARDLMTDDGVIFISIDDGESDNLRKICNEIFGEDNFVADLAVVNNLKGRNDKKYIARANERLMMYVKSSDFCEHGLALDDNVVKEYSLEDVIGKYRLLELRKRGGADTRLDRPNMYYPFYVNPATGEVSLEKNEYYTQIALPVKSNGDDGRWRWGKETAQKRLTELYGKQVGNKFNIYEKDYLESDDGARRVRPKSVLSGAAYSTDVSTKEYRAIMGKIDFSNPKSVTLLSDLIIYATHPDEHAIIMDFFSGSSTTAHAVMKSNLEENGNRKYIMVQLQENSEQGSEAYKLGYKNICEIAKERIRRAGDKIKSEHPDADLDIGFKVFRTADTNIKWNSLMDMGQVDMNQLEYTPDLVDFMPDANDVDVVYELMLRQRDVALSETLEQLSEIGSRTYLYASSYLVCLETKITEELVAKLADLDPLPIKFIFRDSAFKDDIALKDETFRRLKALIEKNAGINKPTYTVEFI